MVEPRPGVMVVNLGWLVPGWVNARETNALEKSNAPVVIHRALGRTLETHLLAGYSVITLGRSHL